MAETAEGQIFTTPEMASLYARLKRERVAKAMKSEEQEVNQRLKNAALGLPLQEREESVIDAEVLQKLQVQVANLRSVVLARGGKPYAQGSEEGIPTQRSVWEGEKDSIKFYMEADPGTNTEPYDDKRFSLVEGMGQQQSTEISFFFDGTFELIIYFGDKLGSSYNTNTRKLEEMTKEESGIITNVLEQGKKALPKLN